MKINEQNIKEILLRRNYLGKEDLEEASKFSQINNVSIIEYLLSKDLISEKLSGEIIIEDILLREGYITPLNIEKAETASKESNISIIEYLLSEGLITNTILGEAIAEWFNLPYANLNSKPPNHEQVLKIPEELAKKYRIVLLREDAENLILATDNPKDPYIISEIKKLAGPKNIFLNYALTEDIDVAFLHYLKPLKTRFIEIIKNEKKVAPEIVEEIFKDALTYKTSDIHFEPQEKEVVVRFRIDGILHESGRIPKIFYENILNRIKVQARMRIDEHLSAQDGAIRYENNGEIVNMRVSVVPTLDGEKIVIRLLAEYLDSFSLSELGLIPYNQKLLLEAVKKPNGMIIVTGPTGSGKTTTSYAILKILNSCEVNITTIEDPVEYKILGINQIQVNSATNLTFAKGLQSIIRQDPNIILVGEIRDKETAEIAVNASLTGHLLLSTFHANDASSAIPRFLDMDIGAYLLSSTLQLVIAQRLIQKICLDCRFNYQIKTNEVKKYFPDYDDKEITLFKGKGCEKCNFTGLKGRTGIFEFVHITQEIHDLILKNPSARQVWDLAKKQGARSLFEDGIEKVKKGITTLEELLRVAPPVF